MNRTLTVALAAAAIFAGLGLAPNVASAGEWGGADIRADKRDIRADRFDLRRDRADLHQDYRDLYRDLSSWAMPAGICRTSATTAMIFAATGETSVRIAATCSGTATDFDRWCSSGPAESGRGNSIAGLYSVSITTH